MRSPDSSGRGTFRVASVVKTASASAGSLWLKPSSRSDSPAAPSGATWTHNKQRVSSDVSIRRCSDRRRC